MRQLLLFVLLFSCAQATAQQTPAVVDSLRKKLSAAATEKEKVELLGELSLIYLSIDRNQSEAYNSEMLALAEMSRSRPLMIKAKLSSGRRHVYMGSLRTHLDTAIMLYEDALSIARQSKLDEEIASAYLALSEVYRSVPELDKALSFCNQANSYISTLQNDSLRIMGHLELGAVYTRRREKLLALRNYLAAQRIAEESGNKAEMQRACYSQLSAFYASIEDYDRAIDLQVKTLNTGSEKPSPRYRYERANILLRTGQLYTYKKDYAMATRYFNHVLRLADTLDYQPMKVSAYVGLLNNYLFAGKPAEAKQFFDGSTVLKKYLTDFGYGPIIDQAYGYIYADLGRFDSAQAYYQKAAPFFEQSTNQSNKYAYYEQMGRMYKLAGKRGEAVDYYSKASVLAQQTGDLKLMSAMAAELDTLYEKEGNYQQSRHYAALHFQYKDSLDKLGKEKDLMQMEAADEQQRQERIAKEQEEAKKKRYSIQYTGITVAIATLFILLTTMGFFKVSRKAIKMIGFFTFLMFFEFLFLIFKKKIAIITHGEPWKDLLFMIGLAAVLLPLHHWLEEKVIHYLTSRKKLKLEEGVSYFKKLTAHKKEKPFEPYQ